MPLDKIEQHANYLWGLWKIEEGEELLLENLSSFDTVPENITHPNKRLEFITGRMLAKALFEKLNQPYAGVTKDIHGKPFFRNSDLQLSLSHSYPYVAALVRFRESAGIDLEQIKPKLLRIAHRVLHPTELADAGHNETKHCIYWCAKETLVKVYGKKDLVFAENLLVNAFPLAKSGILIGNIQTDEYKTAIPLQYQVFDSFVVVFNI
jgi:4'-phosphopantetheinyl transferase